MSDKRTRKQTPIATDSNYYSFLAKMRGVKKIIHLPTPRLKNANVNDRKRVKTITHIWKYGDRLYKLADQYYGDSTYWWVIAWYNGYSTEAQIETGRAIKIPLSLEVALDVLGV